ncbi:MAG: hypothetical protein OXM54_12670, partial [Acidimicrobiaceae bacterium]|nr:hypothetical protein [Acidimicrobiaceae bacterium]
PPKPHEPLAQTFVATALVTRMVAEVANQLFADGFTVIVDDVVVTQGRLDGYLAALRGAPLHYVLLAPPREIVLERDRRRTDKSVAEQYLWLYDRMEQECLGIGLDVDTSPWDEAETATVIAAAIRAGQGLIR